MQEKKFSTKWEKPTKSMVRKSVQKIWGNWGTFLIVVCLGFFGFCNILLLKRNSGLQQWESSMTKTKEIDWTGDGDSKDSETKTTDGWRQLLLLSSDENLHLSTAATNEF